MFSSHISIAGICARVGMQHCSSNTDKAFQHGFWFFFFFFAIQLHQQQYFTLSYGQSVKALLLVRARFAFALVV
jgi:hypothetical protein